jgi:predicted DNA-binding protein with PD1-like motif
MTSTLRYLSSGTKVFAFRGKPHQDIKVLITQFAADNGIKAGAILTTVGSLEQINIRYANKSEGDARQGYYEIVSLTGTFSESSAHLHLAVADGSGQLIGGHLLTGNLIYTTAEIVVVDLIDLEFHREVDSTYNYKELAIKAKS